MGMDYEISWNINNINFRDAEDYIRIRKMDPEFTFEMWRENTGYDEHEPDEFLTMEEITRLYSLPAFSVEECIDKFDNEQLFIAISLLPKEELFKSLHLISEAFTKRNLWTEFNEHIRYY